MGTNEDHAHDRVPPALLLGLALLGVAYALFWLVGIYLWDARPDEVARLQARINLAAEGVRIAVPILLLAGVADLRRRVASATTQLVTAGLVLLLVVEAASLLYRYWILPGRTDWDDVATAFDWLARARCAAAVMFAAGIVVVGRGLPRVHALAAPLVVLAAITHPTRWISETFFDLFSVPLDELDVWLSSILGAALELGFAASALAAVAAIARTRAQPAHQPIFFAAEGFFRIGSALVAQVAIAVLGLLCLLLALGARSIFFLKVATFVVPIATLLAAIVLVLALLRAADLRGAEAPRRRLYVAAGLVAWTVVVTGIKTLVLYQLSKGNDSGLVEETAEVLSVGVPLALVVALLCVVSAVGAVAGQVRRAVTPEGAMHTGIILVVCTGAAVALQHWAQDGGARDAGTFIVMSMVVLVANVFAQLAVARLCQRLAGDLHEVGETPRELPRAEVRG